MYTANDITFHPNPGTLKETSVFCGTLPPPPPPPHQQRTCFFFSHVYINFSTGSSPASPPRRTVLLSTPIRYGVISYEQGDAKFWNNNRAWRPPDDVVQTLRRDWASTAYATVEFITDDNGVAKPRVRVSLADNIWNNCSIS